MNKQDLAFAAIRHGELSASEGWKHISSLVETQDAKIAGRLVDALRAWTWRALDRRRRDDALREWVDVLNRVEAFIAQRFSRLAGKIEALVELLHESLAVAARLEPESLIGRKHVQPVLRLLADDPGGWVDRSVLMDVIGLRPANTTRLMSTLLDAGWVEQCVAGREVSYRATTQGLKQASGLVTDLISGPGLPIDEMARIFRETQSIVLGTIRGTWGADAHPLWNAPDRDDPRDVFAEAIHIGRGWGAALSDPGDAPAWGPGDASIRIAGSSRALELAA